MLTRQLGTIARGRALQQLYCSWALTDITTRVKLEGMDEGIQENLAVERCVTLGCSTDLEVELHTLVKRWPSLQVAGIAHASSLEENEWASYESPSILSLHCTKRWTESCHLLRHLVCTYF